MNITVDSNGNLHFIYSDELAGLLETGESKITRASHVEPHPTQTGWLADMRPVNGPILGANGRTVDGYAADEPCETMKLLPPFSTRAEALAAEVEWLQKNRGL